MKAILYPLAVLGLTSLPVMADEARPDTTGWFADPERLTQTDGETIYRAVCAACHMPEGQGAVGAGHYPALAKNEMLAGADYPVHVITHGQKAMPPIGEMLDDAQVAAVVNYIRTHFGNNYTEDPATPESVAAAR
ncbi:c-type cytochrome [Paenirhodobacter sp.]|uniref:c-type cytochrome n=1 Tax=Paenirhodobacter sp. TaxID=1965326 RepID=UPI003B41C54B